MIGEPPEAGALQSIKTKLLISYVVGAAGYVGVNAQSTTKVLLYYSERPNEFLDCTLN
jgi:hypothetical protein